MIWLVLPLLEDERAVADVVAGRVQGAPRSSTPTCCRRRRFLDGLTRHGEPRMVTDEREEIRRSGVERDLQSEGVRRLEADLR